MKKTKKNEIGYNEAVAEIETIISRLEDESMDVDELTGAVKRASSLIQLCRQKLHNAGKELDKLFQNENE